MIGLKAKNDLLWEGVSYVAHLKIKTEKINARINRMLPIEEKYSAQAGLIFSFFDFILSKSQYRFQYYLHEAYDIRKHSKQKKNEIKTRIKSVEKQEKNN